MRRYSIRFALGVVTFLLLTHILWAQHDNLELDQAVTVLKKLGGTVRTRRGESR